MGGWKGCTKIESGHYRIDGARCKRIDVAQRSVCGGELRAQRCGTRGTWTEWELYCSACKACDVDGYQTLAECVVAAKDFGGKGDGRTG